jgi:protein-S-isoprenylcysteine O-methyltransferase
MQMRPLPFVGGPIYGLTFWLACALWILPELLAWKVRRFHGTSQARDRGSLALISLLWLIGIAMGFSLSLFLSRAAIHRERAAIFWIGIGLMLIGTAFRWYSAAVLGKYFTFNIAIQTNQELIEAGPYRYIRHPSYSGALLALVGFGLALGNWAGLVVAVCCLGLAYAYRIPLEEDALAAAFGQPYTLYKKRTWRLLPFVF